MKTAGIILILAVSVCISLIRALRLRRRYTELEAICTLIRTLLDNCRYSDAELSVIFKSMQGSDFTEFLPAVQMMCDDTGVSAYEAASSSLSEMNVQKEDGCRFTEFFERLGKTDRDGQIENCARHLEYFEKRASEEKNAFPASVRVFSSVSLCVGAAAVLIMI